MSGFHPTRNNLLYGTGVGVLAYGVVQKLKNTDSILERVNIRR